MLTEVATGPTAVNHVAASMSEAEEARRLRRDATAMVERMAAQARRAGAEHPVAAAVAQAARVGQLCGPEAFARRTGIPAAVVAAAESGSVAFGRLARGYDPVVAELGVDLLSLADLERQWREPVGAQGALF